MTKKLSLSRHLNPSPNPQNQTCPQGLKGQFALPMFMTVMLINSASLRRSYIETVSKR